MSKIAVERGRPAGMRAGQLELKQTLLEHPDVPKLLEKVVSADCMQKGLSSGF